MPSGSYSSSSQTLDGPAVLAHPVNLYSWNPPGQGVQTVTLQLTPSGASTRTIQQIPLGPGESFIWSGLSLGANDILSGYATTNGVVNWVTSALPTTWTGPTRLECFTALGELKTKSSSGVLNNSTATTDPTAISDGSLGYNPGSVWVNTNGNRIWFCVSSTPGAAVWSLMNIPQGVEFGLGTALAGVLPASALTGQMVNIWLNTSDRPGTILTRRADQLFQDHPGASVGQMLLAKVINGGRSPLLLLGGSGVTGGASIPAAGHAEFLLTFVSPTVATLRYIGGAPELINPGKL